MLNHRQLLLLDYLESQSLTAAELARRLNVSGRTVLRDIDYLNFTLGGVARITTAGNGYLLEIADRAGYFAQLQRHDSDDQILFTLLLNAFTTRVQLSTLLNLPEKVVADRLSRLRKRYARCFTIASRPNAGHFIHESRRKKVILLTNLIRKDPLMACRILNLDAQVLLHLQIADARAVTDKEYRAALLLAVYALRNQESGPAAQGDAQTVRAAYDAAGLYLPERALREAAGLLHELCASAEQVSGDFIREILDCLWREHGLDTYDQQLIDDLTAHIARCAANPSLLQESRRGMLDHLKAAWPVAFDLSIALIGKLRQRLSIDIHDSDLLGLYFACALDRNQGERHTLVLLAAQNAIATINQLAIERELLNCRVVIAHSPQEAAAACKTHSPMLVINNSPYSVASGGAEVLSVRNIITPAGIAHIKERLEYLLLKRDLADFIPQAFSFLYANAPGEAWTTTIAGVCARLVRQGQLSQEEAQRICRREGEGDNLVVNHLAIPHCWSEEHEQPRGYFVRLSHPVAINGEMAYHLLLICINPAARRRLKIFSYLADALNKYDAQAIAALTSHGEFIALLTQTDCVTA